MEEVIGVIFVCLIVGGFVMWQTFLPVVGLLWLLGFLK